MLAISRAAYDAVVTHARTAAPAECCGVLGGAYGEERSQAATAREARNVSPVPEREYEIDPEEQYELLTGIEDGGRDVVGFYHSHPRGPPRPSATDRTRATWAGYTYLIVDLAGEQPFVGAWRWTGEGFEREAVELD